MSGSGPCSSCRKRCCTNYTVSITGYDAWTIGKGLHLPLESFLIHFTVSAENDRGFLLEPGGTRYEIAVDKAGRYQKGNPCVFWVELSNGSGRCGIYPCRPMVCQTYPAYQQEEMVVLRDDVLCPEGSWNLVGMDLPVFRERLSRFRMEQDIYAYIVAGWNRTVEQQQKRRDIKEYYTVLMNVYEELRRYRESTPHEVQMEMIQKWGCLHPSRPNPLFADLSSPEEDEQWHAAVVGIRRSVPWFTESQDLMTAAGV